MLATSILCAHQLSTREFYGFRLQFDQQNIQKPVISIHFPGVQSTHNIVLYVSALAILCSILRLSRHSYFESKLKIQWPAKICKNLQEMYVLLPFRLCEQITSVDFTSARLPQGCPDLFTNHHESSWHHIDNANRWPKVGSTSCGMSERNITNDPPS